MQELEAAQGAEALLYSDSYMHTMCVFLNVML